MTVLQLIYQDPSYHPVVRFSCQVFAERGDRVRLLARTPERGDEFPPAADFGPGTVVETVGAGRMGWRNKFDFARYVRAVVRAVRRDRPGVVVAYNFLAAAAAYWAVLGRPGVRLVYHNLDMVEPHTVGRVGGWVRRAELAACRRAVCVTTSSPGRATTLQRFAGLAEPPLVVKNCQRLRPEYGRTGQLAALLAGRGLRFDRLVVRLGLLGPLNAVEEAVRSVPHWASLGWGLVLAGLPTAGFLPVVERLVAEHDLGRRVVVLPAVGYDLWYDTLFAADLGLALYRPHDLGNQTMAGAGNKLNNYLMAGVPSVVPDIPDFVAFAKQYGGAVVADPADPAAIGAAVNGVLGDPARHRGLAAQARRAFEEEFNFEAQYAPVLARLDAAG